MMNMSNMDKAKEYAEGKIAEALNQVIVDAYMAGYNAGYQDGNNKVAKDTVSEDVEYVDLGLPSGTLWASDYVKDGENVLFLPYTEAEKYNIPSEEQVNELREYCEFMEEHDTSGGNRKYIVLGPNGNAVTFKGHGYMNLNHMNSNHLPFFWQTYNSDSPKELEVPYFYSSGVLGTNYLFSGYKIPIRTVKTK